MELAVKMYGRIIKYEYQAMIQVDQYTLPKHFQGLSCLFYTSYQGIILLFYENKTLFLTHLAVSRLVGSRGLSPSAQHLVLVQQLVGVQIRETVSLVVLLTCAEVSD